MISTACFTVSGEGCINVSTVLPRLVRGGGGIGGRGVQVIKSFSKGALMYLLYFQDWFGGGGGASNKKFLF